MKVRMRPTSVIEARLGIEPNGKVQRVFQNACYEYMDKYVPKRKGQLRERVDLSNPEQIVYESKYARYQYYGMRDDGSHIVNPANYTTPGTGPYWDKRMVSAEFGEVLQRVKDSINRGGK